MQKIEFTKMHGLGNDFVIIDRRSNKIEINDNLIQKLSDRRTGAGCDQLITINNPGGGDADASIDIFNPAVLIFLIPLEIKRKHVEMELDVLQKFFLMKIMKKKR